MISHPKPAPAQAWRARSRRRRQQLNKLLDRLWVRHDPRAITLLDPRQHQPGSFLLGPSSGVVSYTTLAFLLWLLGSPDRAARTALQWRGARQMTHPFTLA
jgi:hypothetical protein